MEEDIRLCRELGVDGVVIGCLTEDGEVDMEANRRLVELAKDGKELKPMSVTFHRAFDRAANPQKALEDIICDVDMVLLMSVNPGFGGQKFIENTIKKIGRLRQLIKESGSQALIEVDGGVQAETAPRLVKAGVDVLVSGSYVFKSTDPYATIHALKELH